MGAFDDRRDHAHDQYPAALMSPVATGDGEMSGALPDISRLRVVRRFPWERWLTASVIIALLALIARAFATGEIAWSYVGRFLIAPAILGGIANTIVMAVLAMAIGILLGVIVA